MPRLTSSRSTCSMPPSSSPRRWCRCSHSAAWCSTATPTTSSPKPNRSPSIPATSCRASTSPTTRCCRDVCSRIPTRNCCVSAARTSTRSPSTGRSARCATSSAMASGAWTSIRGQVAYEPNSLAPDSPREDPRLGLHFTPERSTLATSCEPRSETFADHYSQPRLFFRSMSEPEQRHIVGAFTFELSKVVNRRDSPADARSPGDHRRRVVPACG